MLLYAMVEDARQLPFPRGRGHCPACRGQVLAKCGSIKVHHWAHVSGQECDTWSEGIGPWHLSWQNLIRPEFVEVPLGMHRADILGDGDTVVELQHSAISPEEIEEREKYYGKMVWLIDATQRFGGLISGPRFFFSFGRTKHLQACQKPVVLDFQGFLVQVEALTPVLDGFAGFGLTRDRAWFVQNYLAGRRNDVPLSPCKARVKSVDLWASKPPWKNTPFSSEWIDPRLGIKVHYAASAPYLPVHCSWANQREKRNWPVWWDIISHYPELANGWTQAEMQAMQALLGGFPLILGGYLRLLPARARDMKVQEGVEVVADLLQRAKEHSRAGRIPLLKEETRQLILEQAKGNETTRLGGFLAKMVDSKGHQRWIAQEKN